MHNGHDGNKNNLRTVESQIVQKLKSNEARPKFTGSYKKKTGRGLPNETLVINRARFGIRPDFHHRDNYKETRPG